MKEKFSDSLLCLTTITEQWCYLCSTLKQNSPFIRLILLRSLYQVIEIRSPKISLSLYLHWKWSEIYTTHKLSSVCTIIHRGEQETGTGLLNKATQKSSYYLYRNKTVKLFCKLINESSTARHRNVSTPLWLDLHSAFAKPCVTK